MGAGMIPTHERSKLADCILILSLILANLRATVFIFLTPDTSTLLGPAWIEILLWVTALTGVIYLQYREKQWPAFVDLWRRNWLLGAFLLYALASMMWSVEPVASSFRILELIFATLIASYFGMR